MATTTVRVVLVPSISLGDVVLTYRRETDRERVSVTKRCLVDFINRPGRECVFVRSDSGCSGVYLDARALLRGSPFDGCSQIEPGDSGTNGFRGVLPLSSHSIKLSLVALLSCILPSMLLVASFYVYLVSPHSGHDALFPSEHVNPMVLKITTWGCLLVVVAYEHCWFWTRGVKQWLCGSNEVHINVSLIRWCDGDGISLQGSVHNGTSPTANRLDSQEVAAKKKVPLSTPQKVAITIHIESADSRAGIELKEIPGRSFHGEASSKKIVTVKSVSKDAATLGVKAGMLLLDYPNKSSVVERIRNGPYPVILRFSEDSSSQIEYHQEEGRRRDHSSWDGTMTATVTDSDQSLLGTSKSAPPAQELPPHRFIAAEKGDIESARKRYATTLQWRAEMGMDHIITDPHPNFTVIKKNYPHFYHLRGRNNEPCYYEKPPEINLKALRAAGVGMDDLLRHFALTCEFMWTLIEPSEAGKSIYIIDLNGMGMRDFAGEVVDFVKKTSAFTAAHYPERSGSIFVINVPSWFSIIWKTVSPWIDPVTVKKMKILGYGEVAITKALEEKIPIENIPPEYGGQSMSLGQSPEETMFREKMQVQTWNRDRHEHED